MPEDKWLERASAMIGGIFECSRKFDAWKNWEWDVNKSDEANAAEARSLHLNFVRSFELILDFDAIWEEASDAERRILFQDLVDEVRIFPDFITVQVAGAPPISVLPKEVRLRASSRSLVSETGLEPTRP